MYCIVGLGNPGKEYERNRHNIGFQFVDRVASLFGSDTPKLKFHAEYCEGKIGSEKAFFLKPLTYMNRSGISVSEIRNFYKIPLENIIVAHDELDLPLGEVRVKRGGGSAGHNGLKSLDAFLGVDYFRIRFGVGRPSHKGDVSNWVLGNFAEAERNVIEDSVETVVKLLPFLIEEGGEKFKGRLSTALKA